MNRETGWLDTILFLLMFLLTVFLAVLYFLYTEKLKVLFLPLWSIGYFISFFCFYSTSEVEVIRNRKIQELSDSDRNIISMICLLSSLFWPLISITYMALLIKDLPELIKEIKQKRNGKKSKELGKRDKDSNG